MASDLPAARWPSGFSPAGRALRPLVVNRAVLVGATCVLTAAGLSWVGSFSAQWWAIVAPLVLLIDPLVRIGRTPSRVARAAGRDGLVTGELVPAGRGLVRVLTPTGDAGTWIAPETIPGPVRFVHVGRRLAAVVTEGGAVAYLRRA